MSAAGQGSMPSAETFEALGMFPPPGAPRRSTSDASKPAATLSFGNGADSTGLGYEYVSFGAWDRTMLGAGVGASFGGPPTPASVVPASGSAKFTGHLVGIHESETGTRSVARANLLLDVNFSARSVGFSSSNTTLNGTAAPRLDLGGTLAYPRAGDAFEGKVRSAGGTLSGTAHGAFYGPRAEEAGGTFSLSSSGRERMTGAYGAKR
jgi:C-lobe and N-lobe beta barrels of Tf-binding protein B